MTPSPHTIGITTCSLIYDFKTRPGNDKGEVCLILPACRKDEHLGFPVQRRTISVVELCQDPFLQDWSAIGRKNFPLLAMRHDGNNGHVHRGVILFSKSGNFFKQVTVVQIVIDSCLKIKGSRLKKNLNTDGRKLQTKTVLTYPILT